MKQFLFGLLLGLVLATAAGVWAFGHTPGDRVANELRQLRQQEQLRDFQRQNERLEDLNRLPRLSPGSPC